MVDFQRTVKLVKSRTTQLCNNNNKTCIFYLNQNCRSVGTIHYFINGNDAFRIVCVVNNRVEFRRVENDFYGFAKRKTRKKGSRHTRTTRTNEVA